MERPRSFLIERSTPCGAAAERKLPPLGAIAVNSMKTMLAALSLLAAANLRADPVDEVIIAAMALSDRPNYSWTCSVSDDAQTYDIEGKTQLDGYTWQRQPMPRIIAQRLGRSAGNELEAIFKGPSQYVVETENGWKTLDELPKRSPDWNDQENWYYLSMPRARTPDLPADEQIWDEFGLPPAVCVPVLNATRDDDDKPYSNAQFALARPHDELAVIVSAYADLQVEGNVAWGMLTDRGAQLLLVHDGHEYIKPVLATGRFKLWLVGGTVGKYLVELAGIVVVNRQPHYVRQKSMTVLKDVGTTVVAVPQEAWRRLEGS